MNYCEKIHYTILNTEPAEFAVMVDDLLSQLPQNEVIMRLAFFGTPGTNEEYVARRVLLREKIRRYKAFYSLDCNDGIENAAIGWAQPSPEDYLIEKEELAEYEELIRRLYEAISSLPPMQARRVHARYMLGMKVKDIAAMEGITPSQAGKSIHAALRRLRRYFARQKWTVNL